MQKKTNIRKLKCLPTHQPSRQHFVLPFADALVHRLALKKGHPQEELRDIEGSKHQLVHIALGKKMAGTVSDFHLLVCSFVIVVFAVGIFVSYCFELISIIFPLACSQYHTLA